MKSAAIAFILALIIGYGQTWSAYYAAMLLGSDEVTILGDLSKYSTKCTAPDTANSFCSNAYVIPSSLYAKWGDDAAIGAGQILNAARYRCLEGGVNNINVDNPENPGRTFEVFTTYQTVQLSSLRCKEGVVIEAWSKKGAVRKGYIGGTATVGNYGAIERVKKIFEFFSIQLLFALSVSFLIIAVLSERLYKYSGQQIILHPYEIALPIWVLELFVVSGIAQTFVALIKQPQLFNHISMFLTHFGIALVPLILLKRMEIPKLKIKPLIFVVAVVLLYYASSPHFANYYLNIHFTILTALIAMSIATKKPEFLFLVAIIFSGCLRILGVKWMPAEYATYPFYAIAVSFVLLSKIRLNARIAALAQWAQSSEWRKSNEDLMDSLLEKMHAEIGAGRTTLLSVSKSGQVRIQIKTDRNSIKNLTRTELPPVFAHIFSTRESLFHLVSNTDKYRHISRGATPRELYSSDIFTIIPIESESRILGAVAFTEYPEAWQRSEEQNFLMRYLTRTLESTIVDQINAADWKSQSKWSENLLQVQKALAETKTLSEAHHAICRDFNCFGFLASLDDSSRLFTLHAIEGYPAEVDERLRNGRIYALKENEQGPIAIAANQEKTVIIPDVKLIRGVLHENSNIFFEKSGTQSCTGIPVFCPQKSGEERKLWGILFLERGKGEPFTLEAKPALEQVAAELTNLLGKHEQKEMTDQALKMLSSFVPPRVLERVMSEGMQREDDHGLFVMVDLKDSTRIATEVGSSAWLENARALATELEPVALRNGFHWHYFNWDALYYTRSTVSPTAGDIEHILKFYRESYPIIRAFYLKHYSGLGKYSDQTSSVARVCVSHGDISRGFQEGATRIWTIVGTEMAAMSKLEDLCKRLDGQLFCDETVAIAIDSRWSDTQQRVPSNGRKIFCCKVTAEELDTTKNQIDRAA